MGHKVELLAPAGNLEGFYGAIHAGADAVYLGGQRFGARAYADNFTTQELIECIKYAHLWGRKVYLTVNTLLKETEFPEIKEYIQPFYEAGLDGVIIQDIGVFVYIRDHFPKLKLHVSTQMTITGSYGAALLGKMGAARIVPARELSLEEIVAMKKATGLEVETFIHGAMCYCYSGQCLFSSILGGRSGNRGRCAQPCRLPYRVERDGKVTGECYPFSLKDMCTIEHLPQLIEAGIDSFKIEGRMKKPEYTAGVTAIYRKYIDRYYAGEDFLPEQEDLDALGKLYIRSGRQNGYYFRHNGRDMVTLDDPSYSAADEKLLSKIREKYIDRRPKRGISIAVDFRIGLPAQVSLALQDDLTKQVTVSGMEVSKAQKNPITEGNIRKQLSKLGDTVFDAADIKITMDAEAFYPLGAINELRRQAVSKLEELLAGTCVNIPIRDENGIEENSIGKTGEKKRDTAQFHLLVRTMQQFNAVEHGIIEFAQEKNRNRISRIYLEADLIWEALAGKRAVFAESCSRLSEMGVQTVIALPSVLRQKEEAWLERIWKVYQDNRDIFGGFLVRSYEGLGFLEQQGYGANDSQAVYADAGFYIWNRETMRYFAASGEVTALKGFCIPYELKAAEQHRLLEGESIPCEKVVYGRIPLMVTANCVAKTIDGCLKDDKERKYYLIDRYKKRFPVVRCCEHCMNIVYNSVPLSLHTELEKWQRTVDFRLDFTIEDGRETEDILRYFLSGAKGQPPFAEYTTGHEKRGAE